MASNTIHSGSADLPSPNAGDDFTIQGGGFTIDSNLDASAVNQLLFVRVMPTFYGQIGAAGAPWIASFSQARGASADPAVLYLASGGDFYWRSDSADSDTTPAVVIDGAGHMHFDTTGTVTSMENNRGFLTVGNAPTITTLFNYLGTSTLQDTGSGPSVTTINQFGGTVNCSRPFGTLNLYGGDFYWRGDTANGVNTGTTINQFGGRLIILSPGTLTDIKHYGGTIDASGLDRNWTITNTTGTDSWVNPREPGVQAFLSHPRITFTNAMNKDNFRMSVG